RSKQGPEKAIGKGESLRFESAPGRDSAHHASVASAGKTDERTSRREADSRVRRPVRAAARTPVAVTHGRSAASSAVRIAPFHACSAAGARATERDASRAAQPILPAPAIRGRAAAADAPLSSLSDGDSRTGAGKNGPSSDGTETTQGERTMLLIRKFIVRKHERGLLYKDGDFVRFLAPGTYRFVDPRGRYAVERFELTRPAFEHRLVDYLIEAERDEVDRLFEVVVTGLSEVAVVYHNERVAAVL